MEFMSLVIDCNGQTKGITTGKVQRKGLSQEGNRDMHHLKRKIDTGPLKFR